MSHVSYLISQIWPILFPMDILKNHRHFWNDERKQSIFWGVLLLAAAIIIQIFAGHYSSRESIGAPAVGDIFLNNLPVLPLDFVIVIGAIIFWTFLLCSSSSGRTASFLGSRQLRFSSSVARSLWILRISASIPARHRRDPIISDGGFTTT